MKELCIKALAVIFISTTAVCVFAAELLEYAIAKKEEKAVVLANNVKDTNSAIDKLKCAVLVKSAKRKNTNGCKDIPFLCDYIKYRCNVVGETVMFSNSNQLLCYSPKREICVFYKYRKVISYPRISLETCDILARQNIYRVFSKYGNSAITDMRILSENSKTVRYKCFTNITGAAPIYITLARDTGSVVFFCIIY